MTVIPATLDGVNGFACAFDEGRSMGDRFAVNDGDPPSQLLKAGRLDGSRWDLACQFAVNRDCSR
jgi:hypothetical protein